MIGRRIGRFRIVEKIGEGGMASVWKAHDELLDRTVALKTLSAALSYSDDARRRFHHEAEVGTSLDHPGIAAIYATGEDHDVAYLAMAYIDGETLAERLARRLIPIPEVVEIVTVAAAALGYAHARGVVHRDVTSRNIMLARDGRVFVLDFGLAIAAGISRITSQNTTVGTIAYMAPELLAGYEADARTDLYGLGVVFYEALTGTLPFTAKTAEVLKYAALNQEPRVPRALRPEVPPELERVALKAIARDPEERYQTADELMRDLQAAGAAAAAPAPAGTLSPGARRLRDGDPVHLAVLPIETPDESADPDGIGARIGADLTAALAGTLARAGRIHVVTPSAPFSPAGDAQAMRHDARREGVHLVLRASLRRDRSQLRLTYAVHDTESLTQIGGGTLGGSVTERFDFEDRVLRDVERTFGVTGERRDHPLPQDPAAADRYTQALSYLKRSDNEASVDGAIQILERLCDREGAGAACSATLARAYLMKYEHAQERIWEAKAAAALDRARAIDPDAADVHLATGWLRINSGKPGEAIEALDRTLAIRPDDYDALLGSVHAHLLCGRLERAEEIATRATTMCPDDWRGHGYLAWVRIRRGKVEGAIEPRQRVVELVPDSARGHRNLGSTYYRLGRLEDAIGAYERALRLLPHRETFWNLGTALYHTGKREEAVAMFRRACELAPSDPFCWGNLGNACFNLARRDEDSSWLSEANMALDTAIGLMRERLERNAGNAVWWAFIAGWMASRGLQTEARLAINRALTLAPDNADCLARAGHVFYQLGDREDALDCLKRSVDHGYPVVELSQSLEFKHLRLDPAFEKLLAPTRSK